ncbi:stringent starvation protein B [Arenimonas maotaiensis]|jgi:stringent starvation protein B|uniref:Stringent starvation protein B n=1 Tax=Arenimonas maotaiensis TaxID=1446479 RepID=A0A917CDU1_9GAMM|nr:ClpXP protease specificity-enhancing factor [Arenimonas maotaiensis]MCC6756370.1 ClpXP protease specificity-enhancing factor [Arenimonas sp.]GGF85647.1 stringent starvation protein B [Arenimonas maotaiensis]
MADAPRMSSNRPYLLRALYEWINDNDLTPYILVDARQPDVQVPASAVKDGKVVLNIAMRAVEALDLGNDGLSFKARFGGVSQFLYVPVAAVIAIYAHETGQGMMLPPDEGASEDVDAVSAEQAAADAEAEEAGDDRTPPPPKGGHLRIVK